MKIKRTIWSISLAVVLAAAAVVTNAAGTAVPSDESDVRATVQRVFDQLKSGQYEVLYEGLPTSFRARITKARFVNGLKRTSSMYRLDRIEIGAVRVAGNMAVVDTTIYAHVNQPFDADAKLFVPQYLISEVSGQWSVATGDNATINRFLKTNPSFARRFPIKKPRTFINQNGTWVEVPVPNRRK